MTPNLKSKRKLHDFKICYSIIVNENEYPRDINLPGISDNDALERLKHKMGSTIYEVISIAKL